MAMSFTYWGKRLQLFDDPYNTTILNERAVEIPIARHWLSKVHGKGLEVGNVMSHYGLTRQRTIVDLYEHAPNVRNIDVFDIEGTFDWILSVSTVEHVRWDTGPRDPDAALRAIDHLRSLLTPTGRMLVTVGMGWNTALDKSLMAGAGATRACTLVRSGDGWEQTPELTFKPYGATTPWAESVWIGEYE